MHIRQHTTTKTCCEALEKHHRCRLPFSSATDWMQGLYAWSKDVFIIGHTYVYTQPGCKDPGLDGFLQIPVTCPTIHRVPTILHLPIYLKSSNGWSSYMKKRHHLINKTMSCGIQGLASRPQELTIALRCAALPCLPGFIIRSERTRIRYLIQIIGRTERSSLLAKT